MTTFNIFINKCQKSVPIDFTALPEHIQQHLIEYGLTQKLNDCHSGEENPETAWGLVQNLAERLASGDISKRAAGKSPEVVEAITLMRQTLKKASTIKSAELNKMTFDTLVKKIAAAAGKEESFIAARFLAKAKEVIAVRQATPDLDITL